MRPKINERNLEIACRMQQRFIRLTILGFVKKFANTVWNIKDQIFLLESNNEMKTVKQIFLRLQTSRIITYRNYLFSTLNFLLDIK